MYKDTLFKLIRNEEVVIWAGSGFSLYAGFPSGKDLCEILLKDLSEKERTKISNTTILVELAEEYYRIKGNNRNSLIRLLKSVFEDRNPKSTTYHDKIASIPHFKCVITTNYDTLFETAYKKAAQVIFSPSGIPYIDKSKVQVFKVHGDLSEPDSVIITKSDYNRFFKNELENNVFWTVINERIATKCVLFLGYNLEDPNISILFERMMDVLKSNKKESFLIAPDLPQHKVNDLILKGIHYIDCTAESLIDELLINLKENVIEDLEKGITSADTFKSFLLNHNLLPDLKGEKDAYKLSSIKGSDEKVKGEISFSIKNDKEFIREFNDIIMGRKIGGIEVPADMLLKLQLSFGGIKLPHYESVSKLEFQSVPRVITKIDIRFDDGTEFTDIPIKLYGSMSVLEIHAEIKTGLIVLNIDLSTAPQHEINFKYTHGEFCKKVADEIVLFSFMMRFCSGEVFTVFNEKGKMFSHGVPALHPMLEHSKYFLQYFEYLRQIEQYFKVRFIDFPIATITEESTSNVLKIITLINNQKQIVDWDDELTMELINESEKTLEQIKSINIDHPPVVACHKQEESVELHGHVLKLGYKKIEIQEAYVSNLDLVLSRKENIVKIRSVNNKVAISYDQALKEDDEV